VAGLVDEVHLMIGPAFLGGGTPVSENRPPMALRLLESRILEGSELTGLRPSPTSMSWWLRWDAGLRPVG